jgi:hypothetical protein
MVNQNHVAGAGRTAVARACALLLLAIAPPLVLLEVLSYGSAVPDSALGAWARRTVTAHGRYPVQWLDWCGRAWVPAVVIASGACLLHATTTARRAVVSRAALVVSAAILVASLIDLDAWSSNVLYMPSTAALALAALWLLLVAGLSARYSTAPALARFGVPAIGIWSLGELLLTAGWSAGELHFPDDPMGAAIDAAYARLDQPWAAGAALLAATLLVLGALSARARPERLALLALGLWAASRGALDVVELRAAQRFVQHRDDMSQLLAFGAQALTWDLVSSAGAAALALAAVVAMLGVREARERRSAFALFALLASVAVCFVIDAARLPGVADLTAAQTLAQVLKDSHTRPLASSAPGGSMRAQVALLHKDRSMTVLSHGRRWRVDPHASLPVLTDGLVLYVDERVSIGELAQMVERLPDDYALLLGRITNHLDAGSTTQRFEPAARALMSVTSQWLTSPRSAARLAPGAPVQRLAELPQDRPVRMLPASGVLVVDQPRQDAVAAPIPDATAKVPSTAWTLIAWGW